MLGSLGRIVKFARREESPAVRMQPAAFAQTVAMSTTAPAKPEASHEGITFASALRDVLVCGLIVVDARQRLTFISDEARRSLCLSSSAESGASTQALPEPLRRLIDESLTAGKPVAGRDIELEADGREAVTARVSVMPFRGGAREQGAVIVVNDITSAKRLQENFRHFDRLARPYQTLL